MFHVVPGDLSDRSRCCVRRSAASPCWLFFRLLCPVLLLSVSTPSSGQEPVSASPDVTIDLGSGAIAADEDVAVDNQAGIVVLENLGVLPTASDVIALGLDVNGDRLIAFETTTALPGGVIARKGDVVRYDGANYTIEFDASLAGVPSNAETDAVSLSRNGLLLSFDTTVDLPGSVVAADEDLVEWNGTSFELLFDGSSEGVDTSLDIDGAQDLGHGQFLVSFDTTGTVGGVVFADEDILRFDGTGWSLEVDSSALNAAWAPADLDAVMVPEPGFGPMILAGIVWIQALRSRPRARRLSASRSRRDPKAAFAAASGLATPSFSFMKGTERC